MPAAKRTASWRMLERLRYRGHSGRVIRRHRALRKLDFERASIGHPLILLVGTYSALLLAHQAITASWLATLRFWLPHLGIPARLVTRSHEALGTIVYEVPYPELSGVMPGLTTILATAGLCLVAMLVTALLARRSVLPLGYLVWGGCLITLSSCLSLLFAPQLFTHTIATHVATGFEFILILIFFVPLLLTFSYYVFDHALVKKAAGTALITGALVVIAPYQYLIHIALIDGCTLIVMPILQILFGLLFDVAIFVALYAWAVSWEP